MESPPTNSDYIRDYGNCIRALGYSYSFLLYNFIWGGGPSEGYLLRHADVFSVCKCTSAFHMLCAHRHICMRLGVGLLVSEQVSHEVNEAPDAGLLYFLMTGLMQIDFEVAHPQPMKPKTLFVDTSPTRVICFEGFLHVL